VALLLRQSSLLIHVSATNELDSDVVAGFFGGAHLHGDSRGHALQVALITVHDNVLLSLVELVGHLLPK